MSVTWCAVSFYAVRSLIHERRQFFASMIESHQEEIVSGQFRQFVEGLERDPAKAFSNVKICWVSQSGPDCANSKPAILTHLALSLPVYAGAMPIAWVNAEVSIRPAVQLSVLTLAALIVTSIAALASLSQLHSRSLEAQRSLSVVVLKSLENNTMRNSGFESLPQEIRPLGEALLKSALELQELKARQAAETALGHVAAQVAHDIRSPVAALNAAVRELPEASGETRILISAASDRIKKIADDLLDFRRGRFAKALHFQQGKGFGPADDHRGMSPQNIAALVREAVQEKQLQYKDRLGLTIGLIIEEPASRCLASVEVIGFHRVLSNLMNNAIEAIESSGEVCVMVSSPNAEWVRLEIKDDGKGIPMEILQRLTSEGGSFGKEHGNGLGLTTSRRIIESWGGKLELDSVPGRGTSAIAELPLATG